MSVDLTDSQLSSLSLDLSQDTVNQLMRVAVGWKAPSDSLIEEYHVTDEAESEQAFTPGSEDSLDISIKRAVLLSYPQSHQPYFDHDQNGQEESPMVSLSNIPPLAHYQPSSVYNNSFNSSPTSVMPSSVQSKSSEGFTPCAQFSPNCCLRSNVPQNVPFQGDYGFELVFADEAKTSKSVSQTYSSTLKRLYVKIDTKVPVTFAFAMMPPPNFLIRAMCVYKAPHMVGEVVQCCVKHIEELKQKGTLFPIHFIRANNPDAVYTTDQFSNHHSVCVNCSSIQSRVGENKLTVVYTLPCYTSELSKAGQLVQVLFTLESLDGSVMGRCVTDLKVCASPGRDRSNDEDKGKTPMAPGGEMSDANPRKRKRVSHSEVVSATSVSGAKALSSGLSGDRTTHTITTFPVLFPFVDSMVNMLEAVYKVRVVANAAPSVEAESQSSIQSQTPSTAAPGAVELLQIELKRTKSICNN